MSRVAPLFNLAGTTTAADGASEQTSGSFHCCEGSRLIRRRMETISSRRSKRDSSFPRRVVCLFLFSHAPPSSQIDLYTSVSKVYSRVLLAQLSVKYEVELVEREINLNDATSPARSSFPLSLLAILSLRCTPPTPFLLPSSLSSSFLPKSTQRKRKPKSPSDHHLPSLPLPLPLETQQSKSKSERLRRQNMFVVNRRIQMAVADQPLDGVPVKA